MTRYLPVLTLVALSACVAPPSAEVAMTRAADPLMPAQMPAPRVPAPMPPAAPDRSNAEIAADILDLTFRMESGRTLPALSRFEGPVTVALTGPVPPTAPGDLARLLARLRAEAGLDITATTGPAAITIEFVARRQVRGAYANVACFVVPRVSSWQDYRAARGSAAMDWTTLRQRDRMAVFIPADSSPQEVRDCLHEELAQALGPVNDLYQLSDSVFNDDNFQAVLTGFDMLVLRVLHDPALHSGMTEAEVAARLPGLLRRLNPSGERPGTPAPRATPEVWVAAMETALGPSGSTSARKAAAQRALAIATAQGWQDSRLAFSHFAVGRVNLTDAPQTALPAFATAGRIYRSLPGGAIHAAHVDMQLAAFALSQGDVQQALALADRAAPVARAAENAALLATVLLIRAEALTLAGRGAEAGAVRLDSLGWARYGFGAEGEVRARMNDIATLPPAPGNG